MNTDRTSPPSPTLEAAQIVTLSPVAERVWQRSLRGQGSCVEVRATERASYTEYHLTGTITANRDLERAADELLGQIASVLVDRGIQVFQEKLYGVPEIRPEILKRREAQYRHHEIDFAVPVTWIAGTPLHESRFVGVQIWGIVPHKPGTGVSTVNVPSVGSGRIFQGRGFRLAHLPFVRGLQPDGRLAEGAAAQADRMFANAEEALRFCQMTYRDVVRTWIYCARLLEWYGDLNRVRTAHYRPFGFGTSGGPAFPASTGIQGRYADEECLMDVLAMQTEDARHAAALPILHSPRQDQSFNYGSAFSRGMTLEIEGRKSVFISGTASINSAGDSIHIGDAEMQSVETLLCIAAILEEQGGSLENITSATLFCKDRNAYDAWVRVSRLLRVPAFPKVCVLADVCRDNLLVEMEAVATI